MSKTYQKLFATFYDPFMHRFERSLYKTRKELLAGLKGEIIEVGAGTGVNFQFYKNQAHVIAIEPSMAMLKKAEKKIPDGANISVFNFGVCDLELNRQIKKHSIDFVVSMLVLCTIPNPEEALKQYSKWLKPDGKLIVLEHIHAAHPRNKKIQNVINPAWRTFADGCNLNRNTDKMILEAGFKPIKIEYIKRSLRFVKGIYQLNQANNF